jgi:proteic killer suppression protein
MGKRSRKIDTRIQTVALRKLRQLHVAEAINDMRVPPANRLEELKGDLKEKYSIRINQQWRIVFRWEDGAHDVEIMDYH